MPSVWTAQAGGYSYIAISSQSAGCIRNLQLPPGQRITADWGIYRTNWMILHRASVAQQENKVSAGKAEPTRSIFADIPNVLIMQPCATAACALLP